MAYTQAFDAPSGPMSDSRLPGRTSQAQSRAVLRKRLLIALGLCTLAMAAVMGTRWYLQSLTSVFTDDAIIDYSSANGRPAAGRDDTADWLADSMPFLPWKQHYITNVEIDLDGDTAHVRAAFYNPMQLPGLAEPSACGGYYHHDFVRTPAGWKSKHLVEESCWFVNPYPSTEVPTTEQ